MTDPTSDVPPRDAVPATASHLHISADPSGAIAQRRLRTPTVPPVNRDETSMPRRLYGVASPKGGEALDPYGGIIPPAPRVRTMIVLRCRHPRIFVSLLLLLLIQGCREAIPNPAPAAPAGGDRTSTVDEPALAPDTAGLHARIDAEFPGYRLTTEEEIARRFPLIYDGSTPEMFWGERWGSGQVWWVWDGDFDADGQPDRLVLLTSRADAAEDMLGVLFGNGSAAEVVSPEGWGVSVGEANDVYSDIEGRQVRVPGNPIVVVYWEKGADLYYWNNGTFESLTIGD
ncbi:MAG: hypothetical protein H0X65_10530 [Gemmatimonadetes bacterium]|nr:hypothetical protein [Gemmatimonadota bacterium]